MNFLEIIEQARAVLQSKGRITYRTLKRQFALDDEALEDLKEELMYSTPQVVDDAGRGLIWNGEAESASTPTSASPQSQSPASYTVPCRYDRSSAWLRLSLAVALLYNPSRQGTVYEFS